MLSQESDSGGCRAGGSGWEGTDYTQKEKGGEVNMLLSLAGLRVWAEIKKRRTGRQWGTIVVGPGPQDQGLQAAHIQALSLSSFTCI